MKCPKCGYLGFERVDRCRNCGYDFSLAAPSEAFELPLKIESGRPNAPQPLDDIAFVDAAMAPVPTGACAPAPTTVTRSVEAVGPPPHTPDDLPLFGAQLRSDQALITKPSPPRAPLAVRRATPEVPRLRSLPPRAPTLELGLDTPERASNPSSTTVRHEAAPAGGVPADASAVARLLAVVADLAILGAVDAAVVYFTLQICGVGLADLGILPWTPLLAFLLLQNGGYLVAFTAGGQTLGKMAAGIKVVSVEPHVPLHLGRAFVRELLWLVLAVPAGLGLLTVLSRDRRGVHDRFAGTRVVRG